MNKNIRKSILVLGAVLITIMMFTSVNAVNQIKIEDEKPVEENNQPSGVKIIIANGDIHFSPCPMSPKYNHFFIPGIKIGKTINVNGNLKVNGESCDSVKTKFFIGWYIIDPYSDNLNDWLIGFGI